MPPFLTNLLSKPKALIGLGVLGLGLILIITTFSMFNGAQKTMVNKETRLGAQYNDCQNNLDNFVKGIKESLGVADRATSALDKVLTNVVKGRYETGSTANPSGGSAFSAMIEAYPDLSGVSINYANVQKAIFAGRDGFKNCQTALLDKIRDYKAWKDSGLIASKINSMVGAPSDNLEARIGPDVVYGKSALDRIQRLVLSGDTNDAYTTGEQGPIDTNPQDPATPADPTTAP